MHLRVFVISSTAVWFYYLAKVYGFGNTEVDVLVALRHQFDDPSDVLEDWYALLPTPCTWSHVTCNTEDRVTRVDLANANLSGQLVPQLGQLTSLQYLELYSNNITGRIPDELGNLTNLMGLDLCHNQLDGVIPDTLGNLQKLRFLRFDNNRLTGTIPISLTTILSLQVLDFSNNNLGGEVLLNGSFSLFGAISFAGNPNLKVDAVSPQPPTPPSSQSPTVGNSAIWAIARGVAALLFAGAALL